MSNSIDIKSFEFERKIEIAPIDFLHLYILEYRTYENVRIYYEEYLKDIYVHNADIV